MRERVHCVLEFWWWWCRGFDCFDLIQLGEGSLDKEGNACVERVMVRKESQLLQPTKDILDIFSHHFLKFVPNSKSHCVI